MCLARTNSAKVWMATASGDVVPPFLPDGCKALNHFAKPIDGKRVAVQFANRIVPRFAIDLGEVAKGACSADEAIVRGQACHPGLRQMAANVVAKAT